MKLPKQPLIIFSSLYRENKSVARQNISVLKCANYNLGCLRQAVPTSLTVAVGDVGDVSSIVGCLWSVRLSKGDLKKCNSALCMVIDSRMMLSQE